MSHCAAVPSCTCSARTGHACVPPGLVRIKGRAETDHLLARSAATSAGPRPCRPYRPARGAACAWEALGREKTVLLLVGQVLEATALPPPGLGVHEAVGQGLRRVVVKRQLLVALGRTQGYKPQSRAGESSSLRCARRFGSEGLSNEAFIPLHLLARIIFFCLLLLCTVAEESAGNLRRFDALKKKRKVARAACIVSTAPPLHTNPARAACIVSTAPPLHTNPARALPCSFAERQTH